MNKIEKIFPAALIAVNQNIADKTTHKVPKGYNGYISSFGASVITSGLLPTLAFYAEMGKSKGDRTSLLAAIYDVLHSNNIIVDKKGKIKALLSDALDISDSVKLKNDILKASIAIKLALRTFENENKQS